MSGRFLGSHLTTPFLDYSMPSWELALSPTKALLTFEDDFPFPQRGIVSGRVYRIFWFLWVIHRIYVLNRFFVASQVTFVFFRQQYHLILVLKIWMMAQSSAQKSHDFMDFPYPWGPKRWDLSNQKKHREKNHKAFYVYPPRNFLATCKWHGWNTIYIYIYMCVYRFLT